MREILFRAKRAAGYAGNAKWLYGGIAFDNTGDPFMVTKGGDFEIIDPDTVGQYTGLTDKNGVRIFEGDIVGYVPWHNTDQFERGMVKFGAYRDAFNGVRDHHGFYIVWANDSMGLLEKNLSFWVKSVPVVGNVHDNPELLKGV